MSQKQAFLKYFSNLDLDMLDLVLNDSITYFGVSKVVFMEKLSYIFNQVKVEFKIDKIKIKRHRKHKDIYYFIYKDFPYSHKIRIHEEKTEIKNITGFCKIKNDFDFVDEFDFIWGEDQKADFIPTKDYVITHFNCNEVFGELINERQIVLDKQTLHMWCEKHYELYDSIENEKQFFRFNSFRDLYYEMKGLLVALESIEYVEMAMLSYQTLKTDSEIKTWLKENQNLALANVYCFQYAFEDKGHVRGEMLRSFLFKNLYFIGNDFDKILEFSQLYENENQKNLRD